MGRGDKKTKRGKISMGTYGVVRPARVKIDTGKSGAAEATSKPASKKEAA